MIDLAQLREAREFAAINTAESERLAEAADALMSRVNHIWWCDRYDQQMPRVFAERGLVDGFCPICGSPTIDTGCTTAAVVFVKWEPQT